MTNRGRQANALVFSLFKHQIKAVRRGVGGPDALPALAILMQPFSLQTKQHFFFFLCGGLSSSHNGGGRTAKTQDFSFMCVL